MLHLIWFTIRREKEIGNIYPYLLFSTRNASSDLTGNIGWFRVTKCLPEFVNLTRGGHVELAFNRGSRGCSFGRLYIIAVLHYVFKGEINLDRRRLTEEEADGK
jgi:hypothetical protein